MNADILRRLFRAVSEQSEPGLEQVCENIVVEIRKKKQVKLASQLEEILKTKSLNRKASAEAGVAELGRKLNYFPGSPKTNLDSLLTILTRDKLEHHMVLQPTVEARFEKIEREFAARDRLAHHGLQPSRKILLYGPPGCGKTLAAKRLAWATGLNLAKVQFESLISSKFGESASNLKTVFDFCSRNPYLLLFDECDFIARSRFSDSDIGEVQRIVNTFLKLLEDVETPGLIVATTNVYQKLDQAIYRRFDEAFEMPRPSQAEVLKLLVDSLANLKIETSVDLQKISSLLVGVSAADVVKIARSAAKTAVISGERVVTKRMLDAAMKEFDRSEYKK